MQVFVDVPGISRQQGIEPVVHDAGNQKTQQDKEDALKKVAHLPDQHALLYKVQMMPLSDLLHYICILRTFHHKYCKTQKLYEVFLLSSFDQS